MPEAARKPRITALTHRKLQERTAILYARELEKWGKRK